MPSHHRIVLSLAALITATSLAPAQRVLGPDPNRDPRQSVTVGGSAVVDERLALAGRMERLKEWDKSADVYQEIVEKYADRVVAVTDGGDASGAPRYASVTLRVQELLGKWPDEGLQRYRARYENSAASLLETAGTEDVGALSRLMQRYFATDAAKTAGLRLIELYIESGEFPAAAWVGQRVLAHHPGVTDEDRPKLLFRTALAQHLGGDVAAAKANLDELKSKFSAAIGMVRGQEVVLADELTKVLASPAAVARGGASPDVWPIFGGDLARGRVPAASAKPSARLPVDIYTRPPAAPSANRDQANVDPNQDRANRETGGYLNIMPVVDRGELFFQDGQRIYAKGLESGLTLPGWSTYAGADDGNKRIGILERAISLGAQFTVTLTDTSVLAVLRQLRGAPPNLDMNGLSQLDLYTPLVCLDRATGAQRWLVAPQQFPQQQLKNLDLGGSPLVVGDNVYVMARGGKQQQYEDAYVLCFALGDGKLKWACYLASGAGTMQNAGNPGMSPASHLAYSGGRVYAVTNLGAVAAIDAYGGTIVWLTVYPRVGMMNFNGMMMGMGGQGNIGGTPKPWTQNPTIVKDGKVFCLPSDAQDIFVYDAGTGAEVKRMATSKFDNANTLLGVVGDKLIVSGKSKVYCIDWPHYDTDKETNDNIFWPGLASIPGTTGENEDTIRGRGFVTLESVFIPTKTSLRRFSMKDGKIEESFPKNDDKWVTGEGAGNVLVTSDQVIIAGADKINVYSDLSLAKIKLDHEVEAAPNDPIPRLRYAEMLFAAAQINPAVEKLDQAIELLGGLNGMRPGPARDRVFARALAFAKRSGDPKDTSHDPARANALYDRAAAAATSPLQHVTIRLSRAQFAHSQRDLTGEVRLCQEILANPSYRAALIPAEDSAGGATPAATIAEGRIRDCLRQSKEAYAAFERAAVEALAKAQKNNDAAALLAVAQVYPNAKCAPTAMLAAAQAYESNKEYRRATQVLGQAYRKYREEARAGIIEAQARNYLLVPGGMGVAIGRLNEGIRIPGVPKLTQSLKLPDGTSIADAGDSFALAAEILHTRSKRAAQATLPEFNIPQSKPRVQPNPDQPPPQKAPPSPPFASEAPDTILADVDKLLLPPRELRDRARHDRVVTWTIDKGLSTYAVGGTAPLGTAALGDNKVPPIGAVWIGPDLLVWTGESLALFKGDALAAGWKLAVGSLDMPDVVEGDDSVVRSPPAPVAGGENMVFRGRAVRGNAFIIAGGRRGLGPVPAGGRRAEGAPEQIQHVRPVGDRVVIATNAGRIAAIDIASGQPAWQARLSDSPIDQLAASDDFVAARFLDDYKAQIVALDLFAGQLVFGDSFTAEGLPQNITLSPDGMLVYTLPDRVRGKDLFEPGKTLKFGDVPLDANTRPFDGATGPDQLVVSEGRVLAVADRGQMVRIISMDDGRNASGQLPLQTGAKPDNWNSWIRVVGQRLYVFQEQTPKSYNLDDPKKNADFIPLGRDRVVRDAFVGRRHLVVLTSSRPTEPRPEMKANASYQLVAYGRYPSDENDESGKMDVNQPIVYPTDIEQWQPVEGGFYYRGRDRRVHLLKGTSSAP